MTRRIEISSGTRFGRLTVSHQVERSDKNNRYFFCTCECGGTTVTTITQLRSGYTSSCGCLRRERLLASRTKHGQSHGNGRQGSPEYRAWLRMKRRCTDQNHDKYSYYGGRGIRVADEWLSDFRAFLAHIGPRPSPGHSIDRINNEGNYEPGNVRWATKQEQMKNRRPLKRDHLGRLLCKAAITARPSR